MACSPCNYVAKHSECFPADTVKITDVQTIYDSIVYTVPDSINLELMFECDSNNQVLLKRLNETKSKGVETKVVFKDNVLKLSAFVDSIAILNRTIQTLKTKDVAKVNPVNEKLKKDNEKLLIKVKLHRNISFIFIILFAVVSFLFYISRRKLV
jgi:hypothetical protein